jgi:hypothetical protein
MSGMFAAVSHERLESDRGTDGWVLGVLTWSVLDTRGLVERSYHAIAALTA